MSIEQLPSGKYRAVVRHGGAKRASEAVPTKAEARMLEAKLKLEMGSQPSIREQHSVGEVVSGYLADGAVRLSGASILLPITVLARRKTWHRRPSAPPR